MSIMILSEWIHWESFLWNCCIYYSKNAKSACSPCQMCNTSSCPTDSCRNEPIPLESTGMAQESTGMGRNPQEWNWNGQEWHWNGLKWTFWRLIYTNIPFLVIALNAIWQRKCWSLWFFQRCKYFLILEMHTWSWRHHPNIITTSDHYLLLFSHIFSALCGRTKVQDEVGSLVICHRTTKIKIKKESEKKQGGDWKEYVAWMQTVKLKRSGVGFPAHSKESGVGILTCLVRLVF